jgi:fructuronate reductase
MDGSQKLPQRILGTIADNRAAGRATPGLTLAVAAWMRYVGGTDERGAPIDVRDPLAPRLRALCDAAPDAASKVAALLSVAEIFPRDLAAASDLRDALTAAYSTLAAEGARAAVSRIAG